jgi:MoxR-like ATPase
MEQTFLDSLEQNTSTQLLEVHVGEIRELVSQFQVCLGNSVVGNKQVIDLFLIALLAKKHILLTGVPGLAKTTLVRNMAHILQLPFSRIQFTADMMPFDIIGGDILQQENGNTQLSFVPGPIFSNIILADEINRAPSKTQSAFLEAMQEKQVTYMGKTYPLPVPFYVFATQNPIEQEGTYPLPEAQLDRFFMNIILNYPSFDEECHIVERKFDLDLQSIAWPFAAMLKSVDILESCVSMSKNLLASLIRLTRATRPFEPNAMEIVNKYIVMGSTPRGSQDLYIACKAYAFIQNRSQVVLEDIVYLFPIVLNHRIKISYQAVNQGLSATDVLRKILEYTVF